VDDQVDERAYDVRRSAANGGRRPELFDESTGAASAGGHAGLRDLASLVREAVQIDRFGARFRRLPAVVAQPFDGLQASRQDLLHLGEGLLRIGQQAIVDGPFDELKLLRMRVQDYM